MPNGISQSDRARALFTAISAHSNMPLDASPTAAFALLLGMAAHVDGWPLAKGGSQKISDALASYLKRSVERSSRVRP